MFLHSYRHVQYYKYTKYSNENDTGWRRDNCLPLYLSTEWVLPAIITRVLITSRNTVTKLWYGAMCACAHKILDFNAALLVMVSPHPVWRQFVRTWLGLRNRPEYSTPDGDLLVPIFADWLCIVWTASSCSCRVLLLRRMQSATVCSVNNVTALHNSEGMQGKRVLYCDVNVLQHITAMELFYDRYIVTSETYIWRN
jgi:hypothetical protein